MKEEDLEEAVSGRNIGPTPGYPSTANVLPPSGPVEGSFSPSIRSTRKMNVSDTHSGKPLVRLAQ